MLKARLFTVLGSLLVVIAMVVSSTGSFWFMYQPRTPKCLTKK